MHPLCNFNNPFLVQYCNKPGCTTDYDCAKGFSCHQLECLQSCQSLQHCPSGSYCHIDHKVSRAYLFTNIFYNNANHELKVCHAKCNSDEGCSQGYQCFDGECLRACTYSSQCFDHQYCHGYVIFPLFFSKKGSYVRLFSELSAKKNATTTPNAQQEKNASKEFAPKDARAMKHALNRRNVLMMNVWCSVTIESVLQDIIVTKMYI